MSHQTPPLNLAPTRRSVLSTALGTVVLSLELLKTSELRAFGEREQVGVQLLDLGQAAHARPRAAEQLMWELGKRTSVHTREQPRWITLNTQNIQNLYEAPLLVWLGEGPCPELTDEQISILNQYLRAGGMLFIDDISAPGDDRFHQSVRRLLTKVWPEQTLVKATEDHTIFRSFFMLDQPYGRLRRSQTLEHIPFGEMSAILYSRNDTFGAYGRAPTGDWLLPVIPGGKRQREMAFRFGINLFMYATCLNYKKDQVHTLTILRRRQWKAE